ncbi:MAG: sulfatase-like hydrolase/transferase, partial [Bryobacteraceae bacterium]
MRLASAEPKKLNFIFILIDDLGWTDLSCYGSTFYETPNTDRLAKLGMKFTHGYATAPVCSPTRSSVMTGKYPARVNITGIVPGQAEGLALKEVTIAERLKEASYATASIGKWHLGREALYPEKQGFDVNVGGTHIGMVSDFFYPAWKEAKGRGARGLVPVEGHPGDYLADRLTDEALKFIEGNSHRPFFLYLSHYLVHTPMQAKPHVIAKYKHKVKPGQAHNNAIYAAMIESMDDSVG